MEATHEAAWPKVVPFRAKVHATGRTPFVGEKAVFIAESALLDLGPDVGNAQDRGVQTRPRHHRAGTAIALDKTFCRKCRDGLVDCHARTIPGLHQCGLWWDAVPGWPFARQYA
jgi:hypothetical protein